MSTIISETKNLEITEDAWYQTITTPDFISNEELKIWHDSYEYEGFNRKLILKLLKNTINDPKLTIEIIIVCAMRGPQRAAITKLSTGRTIESYGIPASGVKGTKKISCQRILAATADIAAFYLKRMNFGKRVMMDCPAWLQFPSAGSILMPPDLRIQHIEFSKRFSPLIGGVFNEQIYNTMMNNAYLDPKLRLFDELPQNLDINVIKQPDVMISSASSTSSAPVVARAKIIKP